MSASSPLLGLFRLTSAMIDTPGVRNAGMGSSAGATPATRAFSSASDTSLCRCARSSRTPSRMLSSTVMTEYLPSEQSWATPRAFDDRRYCGALRDSVEGSHQYARRGRPLRYVGPPPRTMLRPGERVGL